MSALKTITPSAHSHLLPPIPPYPTLPSPQASQCNDLKVLRFVGSTHGQTSWHHHKSESGPPHTAYLHTTTPLDNRVWNADATIFPPMLDTHASQAALINSWASASQTQPCKASTRNQVIREKQTTRTKYFLDSQLELPDMTTWGVVPFS